MYILFNLCIYMQTLIECPLIFLNITLTNLSNYTQIPFSHSQNNVMEHKYEQLKIVNNS